MAAPKLKKMATPESIAELAEKVFGDKQKAQKWLSRPHMALGDQTPQEMLTTPEGIERVEAVLLQIQYGVLA